MQKKNSGFTLAELLIVVAIIAVLVAVAIPVFNGQLEKSREATDLANVRSAYAEVMAEVISGNTNAIANVKLKQQKDDWQSKDPISLGEITHSKADGDTDNWKGVPGAGGSCIISYNTTLKSEKEIGIVFVWSGGVTSSMPTYSNSLASGLKDLLSKNIEQSFLVANSTYTGSHKIIDEMKKYLEDNNSSVKTWAIISNGGYNDYKNPDEVNYLFSEVDISKTDEWSAGDKIPAIMQKKDGTYEVGMCSLYLQSDGGAGKSSYYVISRDQNNNNSHNAGFDINSVIREDGKKQTFNDLNEAYAYYNTLSVEKK